MRNEQQALIMPLAWTTGMYSSQRYSIFLLSLQQCPYLFDVKLLEKEDFNNFAMIKEYKRNWSASLFLLTLLGAQETTASLTKLWHKSIKHSSNIRKPPLECDGFLLGISHCNLK